MIDALGGKDRDVFRRGQLCYGIEPDIFVLVVLMRKNGGNLKAVSQQGIDAFTADVVISQDYYFHNATSEVSIKFTIYSFSVFRPTTL